MDTGKGDWLWQCTIPEGTELQEHTLKTGSIIIIGDRCRIDYGLSGDEVIVSEFCQIKGNICAGGDLRIDNWSEITGDVTTDGDAYLGEGVKINGRLVVLGDLDLGDNVHIDGGFEAKGWISIRNPMPVIAYIMLYLITLLGLEKEEDIENFFQKFFSDDDEEKPLPLIIPPNSTLNMEVFSVPGTMRIGPDCRLHGNIRAQSANVEKNNTIFGSLGAEKDIKICENTTIHGALNSGSGNIEIEKNAHILGDVRCQELLLDEESRLDGTIRAPGGVKIVRKK
ncbi:MAG: polymer-forming cytoskeletal protein [Methanomicrobiaceae archaeon]|nr:polymer-forming cytoskeletal protein [Methanomicrobiaceae archaeon]